MTSTRRSLLKSVAAVPALLVSARTAAPAAEPTPTPAVAPSPSPSPTPVPKPSLLAQAARERYGKFLTEEQVTQLDERMAALERTSARLRSFKLGNGEEPTTDFRVRR
jgi:transposase